MKTSKLRVTGLCEGNSPVTGGEFTGEFPAQRSSNVEHASICWRHYEDMLCIYHMIHARDIRILCFKKIPVNFTSVVQDYFTGLGQWYVCPNVGEITLKI